MFIDVNAVYTNAMRPPDDLFVLMARHPRVARALYLGFGLQKETVSSWVGAFAKAGYARSILSTLRNIPMLHDHMPMYARVGRHPRPVLLVWGTEDGITPYRCAREVLRAMPRARLATMRGLGHGPFCAAPRVVADAVLAFQRGDPLPAVVEGQVQQQQA